MESRSRANVEIKIRVMHVMESPEQWNHVVGPMPPPVSVIHEQKRGDASGPSGQSDPVQQTDMPILCPNRYREWDWQHGKTDDGESRNREHKIAYRFVELGRSARMGR